jgi:hypothetical protein
LLYKLQIWDRRQVASISIAQVPPSIRTENAQLVNYLYVDMRGCDLGGYVNEVRKAVQNHRCDCRPVIMSNGAASSNIWNGLPRASKSSFR